MKQYTRQIAIDTALAEIAAPTLAMTDQLFGIHQFEVEKNLPRAYTVIPGDGSYEVYFKPKHENYFLIMIVENVGDTWKIRGCRAEAGTRIYLSIRSDLITANDITHIVGIQPTTSWSKGDERKHLKFQHLGPYQSTSWDLCPDNNDPGEFEHKLTHLLDLITPTASKIQALKQTCDINIVVSYYGYRHQMWGLPISAKDMARIATLGAGIDVDLYASGPDFPENI